MSRLVLVLGCHRSGTSLIAKATECLGASLGDNADWYAPDNPMGFAEDRDILAINEALLRRYESSWNSLTVPTPSHAWANQDIRQAAKIMLERKLSMFPLLTIKEPRLCRLLPFWRRVIAWTACEVSVVHVLRHPWAVAKSLEARNGIPVERGMALWLDHVQRARADCDPTWPSVTVRYEDMLRQPIVTLSAMEHGLDLSLRSGAVTRFLDTTLLRSLQHHVGNDHSLPPEIEAEWSHIHATAA